MQVSDKTKDELLVEIAGLRSQVATLEQEALERQQHIVKLNQDLERRVTELQTLFEFVPVGLGISEDPECKRITINPAYAKMLKIPPTSNVSENTSAQEAPTYKICRDERELKPEELPLQYASIHGVEVIDSETDYIFEDGSVVNALGYAAPLFDEQGKVRGSVSACFDITERRRAEEAQQFLAEASMYLASSLDYEDTLSTVAQLVVTNLADWCAIDLLTNDDQVRRVAAAHHEAAKQKLVYDLHWHFPIHPPVEQALRTGQLQFQPGISEEAIAKYVTDPQHFQLIKELGFKSGMVVPLVARGRTIGAMSFNRGPHSQGYKLVNQALAEDLARRVALAADNAWLYEEAQRAIERQKELDKLKDQFLSIASHELRTPLTSIKGYAQVLERLLGRHEAAANEQRFSRERGILNTIVHQSSRMNELVSEMLDVSRLENGQFELKLQPDVGLLPLVRQVVEQHQVATEDHAIELITTNEELPTGTWDEARLEQVLSNLISNAIKYSPPDTTVKIGVQRQSQNEVLVWVRDEGFGINPAEQAYVFDRFYRVRSEDTVNLDGLGLGLYISYQIIARHGGRMWLESQPGKGSTFYFSLPFIIPE